MVRFQGEDFWKFLLYRGLVAILYNAIGCYAQIYPLILLSYLRFWYWTEQNIPLLYLRSHTWQMNYTTENNKEAWKTYVSYTPPGVFTKSPVLASIGNHWRHFLWLQAQPLHYARWIMVINISTVGVHLSLGISWWGLKLKEENSKLDNLIEK